MHERRNHHLQGTFRLLVIVLKIWISSKSRIKSTSPAAPPTPTPESTSGDSQAAGEGGGGAELKEEATGQIEGETPEHPEVRWKMELVHV